ncbi:hypothetical protein M3Y99_01836300 [Aphelenchoides fujianensis]|nr:hypothetical protein M3Y99_01836300 [Aphelenchoides fujianensis]
MINPVNRVIFHPARRVPPSSPASSLPATHRSTRSCASLFFYSSNKLRIEENGHQSPSARQKDTFLNVGHDDNLTTLATERSRDELLNEQHRWQDVEIRGFPESQRRVLDNVATMEHWCAAAFCKDSSRLSGINQIVALTASIEKLLEMAALSSQHLHSCHQWLSGEVEQIKKRFDEETRLLFEMPPTDVHRSTMKFADHSQVVLRHASQLYERLIDRCKENSCNEEIMHHLIVSKKVCEDFLLQVSTIQFGSRMGLLRKTPEQEERMKKLRLKFAERLNAAIREKQRLEIHQIFEGVIAASESAGVLSNRFARCSPTDLYPPESYVDLVDVLTHFGLNTMDRLQIIGYFANDLDATTETADERKYFNVACSCLLNDHMSDAAMREMRKAWSSDQRLVCIDRVCGVPGTTELEHRNETEGTPNKETAFELSSRPTKQTGQQLGEMHQEDPHDHPAHTHTDEPVFVEPAQSEDAELPTENRPPHAF